MKTTAAGKTVNVSNSKLKMGDVVRVGDKLTRVLQVNGNNITFADDVPAATVMSVAF
jgi:hypothetical protein